MWISNELELENFGSHQHTFYKFRNNEATLIEGRNYFDYEVPDSNGSGKSFLIEAVSFILLGTCLRNVNDSDLIRNGQESAKVIIKLYNTLSKNKLEISRTLYRKKDKSSEVVIKLNDVDQKDVAPTVSSRNVLILDLIGISREDLLNCYIVSKKKYISFFYSSNTKKTELISRFSNSNLIDGVEDLVQKDVDKVQDQIDILNDNILQIQTKIDVYNEQLEEQKSPDELKKEFIEQLENKISEYEKEIQESEDTIRELEREVEEDTKNLKIVDYDKEIDKIVFKINSLLEKKVELNDEVEQLEKNLKEYLHFKTEIQNTIQGSVKCPSCGYEFLVGNSEISIEKAKSLLPEVNKEISDIGKQLAKGNGLYGEVVTKISEFNKNKDSLEQSKFKYISLKQGIDVSTKKIKSFEDTIKIDRQSVEKINKEIEAAKSREFKINVQDIKNKIETNKKELEEGRQELVKLEEDKFQKSQWIYNFKRFKIYLSNKVIKSIEGYSNYNLLRIKSNLRLQIEERRLLSDNKTIKEEITPNVLRNGLFEGSFDKFSEGEKGKLDIACILALQNLINLNCQTGGLNLLLTDEITNSIDSTGIDNIIESFDNLNKTIVIITHSKGSKVTNKLTIVEKGKDEISRIVDYVKE